MTADALEPDHGDEHPADDISDLPHRRLRSALEFAVEVAAEGSRRQLSVPTGLAELARSQRLSTPELGRARRAVVAAPAFRESVGEAAPSEVVDEIGRTWLARPPGWIERIALLVELDDERERRAVAEQAVRREQRRRESAERKRSQVESKVGHRDDRVERLAEQVAALRIELDEALADARTLRAELAQRATAERHAADRQRAAEAQRDQAIEAVGDADRRAAAAEEARDRVLAERAGGGLTAAAIADLRRASDQLSKLAADLRATVNPPRETRVPVAVPGAVVGDPRATAAFLMRAEARVIVDGYNVAKLMWPDDPLADQRTLLLDAVDNVVRRYGTDIVVVFDGADVVGARADKRRLSRVVYSPAVVTADDRIRDEVGATHPSLSLVVVTDDREIQRDVARSGANLLPSASFATVARG